MPSKKDIKTRIKAVQSTQKITKAMKLISIIKSKQVQNANTLLKPYSKQLNKLLNKTLSQFEDKDKLPPIIAHRSNINSFTYLILISSDRGLCGNYNSSLFKTFRAYLQDKDLDKYKLIIIGNKAHSFVKRYYSTMNIAHSALYIPVIPPQQIIKDLSSLILNNYMSGEVNEVKVIYNHYISMIKSETRTDTILPHSVGSLENIHANNSTDCIFEPSIEDILDKIFPMFLQNKLYEILLNARASELAHRVNAMTAANDNAKSLIDNLTLKYNKLRQGSITQEILEIISGAEAL